MPHYVVEMQDLPAIPVAVVRRRVEPAALSRVVPDCCGLVWNALRAQGVRGGRNVAIYWDGAINLEAGVELTGPFAQHGELVLSATPGGAVAHVAHLGPYGGLGAAHEAVREWSHDHHQRLAGPNWEIYGHWQDAWNADPSGIRTDVFYLVAP
jgi:effector-binding domain-containing protein